jgi:FMN phosphatase YigB (HAD superfamily)
MTMNNSDSFQQITQQFLARDVSVLSLDCFDTLFWRYVSRPFDIFTQLQHGLCPTARVQAEARARQKKYAATRQEEVTLAEIYAELAGQFDAEQQHQMVARELALESENGFLFSPALALLREAKARGIRTIIVSDTYFTADQLSHLLTAHSSEIPVLIDHIYCSADHGQAKSGALWPEIVQREQVSPQAIFHVGDNLHADFLQPVKAGISARHFRQNEALIQNVLEQRTVATKMLFPACGATAPVPQFFHACYAVALRDAIGSEQLTGWTVLGPVLYAFARFLKQQCDLTPGARLGFLMRDGYMLREAWQALYPGAESAALCISRFTAIKSAFHSQQSLADYLAKTLPAAGRVTEAGWAMIARHLMINPARRKKIDAQLRKNHFRSDLLYSLLMQPDVVNETLARSLACRQRLITHLQKRMALQPGETLMLVDLGYAGTAQNLLGPLLEAALNVKVRGCYLIAAWTPGWKNNRTALINPDTADFRVIRTLTRFISAFEMLCSSHDASAIDYSEAGEPVGEADPSSDLMRTRVRAIQHEALRCVRLAGEQAIPASQALRDAAAIDLARYLYLPLPMEIDLQERLTFDINMGTQATKKIVDIQEGINYMRRYGVSRLSQDESYVTHTNIPSELRYCGMEYALSLLSASRYALSWSLSHSSQRQQKLEVLFVTPDHAVQSEALFATSTFDGFYSLYIPVVTAEVVIAIGKTLRDFELHSAGLIPQQALHQSHEHHAFQPLEKEKAYFIDGGVQLNNLVVNMPEEGFIYFRLPEPKRRMMIALIYRPLNEQAPLSQSGEAGTEGER